MTYQQSQQTTPWQDEAGHGPLYNTVTFLADRQDGAVPTLINAISDPTNLVIGTSVLTLGTMLGWLVVDGKSPLRSRLREETTLHPGDLILGTRAHKTSDHLTHPQVIHRLGDRMTHTEIMGPPRQGKTTLMAAMAAQDLKAGLTVVVLETSGDLVKRLLSYAKAYGRPIHYVDPSHPNTQKWNPIGGDPGHAALRAVSTILSMTDASDPFFKEHGATVLKQFVIATHAVAAKEQAEDGLQTQPTLSLLLDLLRDTPRLENGLKVQKDRNAKTKVVPPGYMAERPRQFFNTEFFGTWDIKQQQQWIQGLKNKLELMLGPNDNALDLMSPKAGEKQLQLSEALNDGGLICMRISQENVGDTSARLATTWFLQDLQQNTMVKARRLTPVTCYLDEIHLNLGHGNDAAARSFETWLPMIPKYNVACVLAYQSFGQLPDELRNVLMTTVGTKIVAGRLGPYDADLTKDIMGQNTQTKENVRRRRKPFSVTPDEVTYTSTGEDQDAYSTRQIRYLERGYWHILQTENGRYRHPVVFKARKPPRLDSKKRRHKRTRPGASHKRRRQRGGV